MWKPNSSRSWITDSRCRTCASRSVLLESASTRACQRPSPLSSGRLTPHSGQLADEPARALTIDWPRLFPWRFVRAIASLRCKAQDCEDYCRGCLRNQPEPDGGQPNSVPPAVLQGRETHLPAQLYREMALVVEIDLEAIRPIHPFVLMSKRWPSVTYCCRVSIDSDAAQLRLKTHYQAYD